MAVTFHGYLFRDLNWIERTLFMVGGLALIYPHALSGLFGYAVIGLLVLRQLLTIRAQRALTLKERL
jgi:TRAP-type uncharacterized transport system fused permease subunit